MSQQIANISLAGAVVGQTGTIPVSGELPVTSPTLAQQMLPDSGNLPLVVVFNETPCVLKLSLPNSDQSLTLPSGRWVPIPIPANETQIIYTVQAVAAGTVLFNNLLADYYNPGEPVEDLGVLGNSPIGGSIAVSPGSANSVDNYLVNTGVLYGLAISADPVVLNQVDVTAGVAFVQQPAGMAAVFVAASSFFTTLPNATYYLDLNPSGSFSWGTSHSGQANYLSIGTVTSNASGTIATVTQTGNYDAMMLLRNADGTISLGNSWMSLTASGLNILGTLNSMAGEYAAPFALGAPLVDGLTLAEHVTATGATTVLSFTPANTGLYRVSAYVHIGNGTSGNDVSARFNFYDPDIGSPLAFYLTAMNGSSTAFMNGSVTFLNGPYSCVPYTFRQAGGHALSLVYTDPTNTPNDYISVFVERIA